MGRARLVWEASFLIFFYYAYVLMTSMMMIMSLMDNDNAISVLSLYLHSTTTVTMYLYLDPVGSCPGVQTKNSRPTDLQGLRRLPEKERRGFTVEYNTVLLCTEYGR